MRCRDPYCANSGARTYEAWNGFLCRTCEAREEELGILKEFCPVCGEYRKEHPDGVFCTDDEALADLPQAN